MVYGPRMTFRSNESGGIAVAFALSLSAIMLATGMAVDYSRASNERSDLQSALDGAILMAGKEALASGRRVTADTVKRYLKGNLKPEQQYLADKVTIVQSPSELKVSIAGDIKASVRLVHRPRKDRNCRQCQHPARCNPA